MLMRTAANITPKYRVIVTKNKQIADIGREAG
jgi:hypothetical protein